MGQASGERWGRTTGGSPCHPGPAAPLVCGAVVGAPGGARQWRGDVPLPRQGRGLGQGTSLACGAQSLNPTCNVRCLFAVSCSWRQPPAGVGGGGPAACGRSVDLPRSGRCCLLFPDAQLYQFVGSLFAMLRTFAKCEAP